MAAAEAPRWGQPISRQEIRERVAPWNKRAHRRSMNATLRWADALAAGGSKPLKKAHWWHGDPYGKRPESVAAWANRVARQNPPQAFRYDPDAREGYGSRSPQKKGRHPVHVRAAASRAQARAQLLKFGVPAAP